MKKFKLIRNIKKAKENDFLKENVWNDRFFVKENNTPNRIPPNKTRAHIKIKSRDIKYLNLNIFPEDELNSKINVTSNLNVDNKLFPIHKSKLNTNKTLNNLLTLKLNKKDKKIINKNKSNNNQNNNNETFKNILLLWDDLGVNYIYQQIFNKIIINLNKEKSENYFLYEYNRLNNINKIINSICDDINSRDKDILELQKNFYYNNEEIIDNFEKVGIGNEENGENEEIGNNNDYDEETIKQALSILIDIRNYSINIINNILLLRKEIGYDIIMNKYDINKIFIFPTDYLIRMNNDLDFLINTPLNKYFNFSKSDPFLLKINNDKFQLTEIKDENKIQLINNFENLVLDELINQELNLMTLNSKSSYDSIFNFTSKIKKIKKIDIDLNNINLSKKKNILHNKIIKANRGLSRQKLRPKISNKIVIESDISNTLKGPGKGFQLYKNSSKTVNNNNHIFKYSSKKILQNEKNNKILFNEEENQNNIKYNNIQSKPINDDELKIFEKFIEQSIIEKNNIDKELFDNKIKTNKVNKILKSKNTKEEKNIFSSTTNKSKFKEDDELDVNFNDYNNNIKTDESSLKAKKSKTKKQISNFIKNILEESEIENSQKLNISKNKDVNGDKDIINEEINIENIEIEAEEIKKAYINFTIELYKDKLSSLKDIYQNYYKKIPEKIKIGFKIQSNIVKYIEGIYPKILLVKSNKANSQIIGIITLNYIAYNSNSIILGKIKANNYNKMLNISSISCLEELQFEEILVNTIDFCQEFFYFEYILLQLYYLNKNGQFILYSDLEKIIKNQAKFKWVNMENDGIDRKIKYRYANNNYSKNKSIDELNNNIINLRTINIIGFEDEENYKYNDIRKLSFINDFSTNYLLLEMIGQNNYKISDNINRGINYINSLISKVTFKKMNHICADFLISQIGKGEDIKSFIKDNESFVGGGEMIEKIDERIFYDLYFAFAAININNSFKNIIKRKYNGFIYNILFNDQINAFSIKDNNNNDMQFFLIKSSEQNTSIIIYEFKKNESLEDIIKLLYSGNNNNNEDNEKNISEVFKELFSKVTKKPAKINQNIYIPSFKIFLNRLAYRPSIFSKISIKNNENFKNYKINCLNSLEQLTFGIDEPYNIQQNTIDLDDNFGENIIIQNDFIISIVDNDLIFELQIPTVSSFLIKKDYWIKSS